MTLEKQMKDVIKWIDHFETDSLTNSFWRTSKCCPELYTYERSRTNNIPHNNDHCEFNSLDFGPRDAFDWARTGKENCLAAWIVVSSMKNLFLVLILEVNLWVEYFKDLMVFIPSSSSILLRPELGLLWHTLTTLTEGGTGSSTATLKPFSLNERNQLYLI
jgi:hypothetical protein